MKKNIFGVMCCIIMLLTVLALSATSYAASAGGTVADIQLNTQVVDRLSASNEIDKFNISLSNPGSLSLNLRHEEIENSSEGWNMELIDENGNSIISENSRNTLNYNTTKVRLPAGKYQVKVYYYYGDYSDADYKLTVNYKEEASSLYEKEWNNDKNSAYVIDGNNAYTGNLPFSNDVDYYKLTTKNPGSLSINFKHEDVENCSEGWNLELQDEDGNRIIDENSRNTINYNTTKVRVPAGTYYLRIYYYYGDFSNVDYKVTVNYTDETSQLFEKEFNDNKNTAYNIETNKSYTGNLPYSRDVDYYKFTAANPGSLSIKFKHNDVENCSEGWNIELHDEDGNRIIDENSRNSLNYNTTKVRIPAGIYYIRIYYYYGDFSNIDYTFTANYTDESSQAFEKEWNNEKSKAYSIGANISYTGNLAHSNDVDYYKVDLAKAGSMYINFKHNDVENCSEGWNIELQNENGDRLIDECTRNNTSYNTAKVNLSKGTYYVRIYYYYGDYSNIDYRLTLVGSGQTPSVKPAAPAKTPAASAKPAQVKKPAAPAKLSVTVTGTTAKLTWAKVNGASYYKVYYKKDKGSYTAIKSTGTSAQLKNLSQVSKYYFKVTAVNSAGEGPATGEISKNTGK